MTTSKSAGKLVIVKDKFQQYKYYRTEKPGEFDRTIFNPFLTPNEMLKLGVFEGKYLNDCKSEFPSSLFKNAKISDTPDTSLNFFGIKSRLPLHEWESKGWVHPDDPRGWFQWYCRYYYGRRHPDDERQIKRWRAFNRHAAQVKINAIKQNRLGDLSFRPKQRQGLLQWSHNFLPEIPERRARKIIEDS